MNILTNGEFIKSINKVISGFGATPSSIPLEETNLNTRLNNIDNKLISHDSYGTKIDNIITDINSIKVDMAVVKNDVTWMKNRTTTEVRTNARRRQHR